MPERLVLHKRMFGQRLLRCTRQYPSSAHLSTLSWLPSEHVHANQVTELKSTMKRDVSEESKTCKFRSKSATQRIQIQSEELTR